jgi:hypothetical protein
VTNGRSGIGLRPCNAKRLREKLRPCYKGSNTARSSTSSRPKWKLGNTTVIRVKGDAPLTYDNTREIASLASEFDFQTQAIATKNRQNAKLD